MTLTSVIVSFSLLVSCAAPSTVKPAAKAADSDDVKVDPTKKPGTVVVDPIKKPDTGVVTPGKTDPITGEPVIDPVVDPVTDPVIKDPVVVDPVDPTVKLNFAGGIDPLNSYVRIGDITGWAVDKDNPMTYLEVNIYFDGDNKTGKNVGKVKANLLGSDDGNGGEHAFIFHVPTANKDGKPHKVYAYATVGGKEVPLSASMPYTLSFFSPKGGAAEAKYKTIGFETKCSQCHSSSFTYQSRWNRLVEEGFQGKPWGETTNYLYEKVYSSHRTISGGKPCSVIDCNKIIEWWKLEFGQ